MSAFLCSNYHLSYLGRAISAATTRYGALMLTGFDWREAETYAQALYCENIKSLAYLYPDRAGTYPERMVFDSRACRGVLDPVQVIKAAQCYDYQVCEHPTYEASESKRMIEEVINGFISALPGYDAAAWSLDAPTGVTGPGTFSETLLYATPLMTIGKHEWRCIVYVDDDALGRNPDGTWSRGHTRRFTRYEWRRLGDMRWKPGREWPRYDINDGCYSGMPRTLVRLYRRHEDAIQSALGKPSAQLVLPL